MTSPLGASRVASDPLCLHAVIHTPAGMDRPWFRSYWSIHGGLPHVSGGSASALPFSRPARCSLALRPDKLAESPKRPFTPEASAASLPQLPLRLLPGGANQFPGGTCTHCGLTPFHGARIIQASALACVVLPEHGKPHTITNLGCIRYSVIFCTLRRTVNADI